MNKTKSSILAAAVSGLIMGGCSSEDPKADPAKTNPAKTDPGKKAQPLGSGKGDPAEKAEPSTKTVSESGLEKHACAGLNSCKNKGGCKRGEAVSLL